jgi:hypothetical protein
MTLSPQYVILPRVPYANCPFLGLTLCYTSRGIVPRRIAFSATSLLSSKPAQMQKECEPLPQRLTFCGNYVIRCDRTAINNQLQICDIFSIRFETGRPMFTKSIVKI